MGEDAKCEDSLAEKERDRAGHERAARVDGTIELRERTRATTRGDKLNLCAALVLPGRLPLLGSLGLRGAERFRPSPHAPNPAG